MPEWRLDVRQYTAPDGSAPFRDWYQDLDETVAARIWTHVDRLGAGNFGDSRSVGNGVVELKINFGPGYRLYYLRHEATLIVLLCGWDKSSQPNDIRRAHRFADDYRNRT